MQDKGEEETIALQIHSFLLFINHLFTVILTEFCETDDYFNVNYFLLTF